MKPRPHDRRRWTHRGFTLPEMVVVVLVIGILAGIAVPKFFRVRDQSEAAAILANVTLIIDAVERYAAAHGTLPRDAGSSQLPKDLRGYLPAHVFETPTSLGRGLDWNGPGTSYRQFGVTIGVPKANRGAGIHTLPLYQELEAHADDGSRSTGWITVVGGNRVQFAYTENPRS